MHWRLKLCLALALALPLPALLPGVRATTIAAGQPASASGLQVLRDLPYGADARQRMDVYLPAKPVAAPVIFMVHGGAWSLGDKAAKGVVENKLAHWGGRGFVFISADYRRVPQVTPMEQAQDIAAALALAQTRAPSWGADAGKFILMGHSAGAHLVALLSASPALALQQGASPWLGTVVLDSAALDVVQIMTNGHARIYDRVFGHDRALWAATSPFQQLSASSLAVLVVCSSQRAESCPQGRGFVAQARLQHPKASLLEQDLSHKDVNQQLGLAGAYTDAVDAFIAELLVPATGR
jgi:acetyl esterase/lipase